MMSAMLDWAKEELAIAGYGGDEDGPNKWLADGVIRLLEVFCEEGHSESSAPYAVTGFVCSCGNDVCHCRTTQENE